MFKKFNKYNTFNIKHKYMWFVVFGHIKGDGFNRQHKLYTVTKIILIMGLQKNYFGTSSSIIICTGKGNY